MKLKQLFLAIVFGLSIIGCTPAQSQDSTCPDEFKTSPHVFVEYAFSKERTAVESHLSDITTCLEYPTIYTMGTYNGHVIVAFQSGVGPYNAKRTTEDTIQIFRVEAIVFSGIAGGIDPAIEIGKTVVPSQWYELETGNLIGIDQGLLDIAKQMPDIIFAENGMTSPDFVSDSTIADRIRTEFGSSVVDMETYSAAFAAKNGNVPFIAFRSVSDYANGHDKSHYQEAADASANATFAFLDLYFSQNTAP